jgi:hypothetical protein
LRRMTPLAWADGPFRRDRSGRTRTGNI